MHAFLAKVFVYQVGCNKHHGPRQYAHAHGHPKNGYQLAADELGHNRIGYKYPGQDYIEGTFAGLEHYSAKRVVLFLNCIKRKDTMKEIAGQILYKAEIFYS